MDEETMQKMFDPYFTTKAAGKGTGLGLATVRAIVENSNGTIQVASAMGAGTEISIFLPVTKQAPDNVEDKAVVRRGEGEHILVVDDERAVLHVTQLNLEHMGYRGERFCRSAGGGSDFRNVTGVVQCGNYGSHDALSFRCGIDHAMPGPCSPVFP